MKQPSLSDSNLLSYQYPDIRTNKQEVGIFSIYNENVSSFRFSIFQNNGLVSFYKMLPCL